MKRKRISRMLAVLLAFTMVFTGSGMGQWTPDEVSAETVIEVNSQADLAKIGQTGGTYKLVNDITLNSDWTPITIGHYDSAVFDGNGHMITLDGSPLFEKINDGITVKNLVLQGTVSSIGGIGSFAKTCNGTIRNSISYVDVTYTGTGGTSYSPHYIGGIAGSMSADSGTIYNCVYNGLLNSGDAPLYGGICNFGFFVNGSISNSITVGQDRVGMSEGMSSHSIISTASNIIVQNKDDWSPDTYVSSLNANLKEGDLSWNVVDGILAPRGSGEAEIEEEASEEEISALETAITNANAVDKSKVYTADTWSSFSDALVKAESVKAGSTPLKQKDVINATTALTRAKEALTERSLAAVDVNGDEIISITDANGLKKLETGKYYRLDADITVSDNWFGVFNSMDGILDGNGHTITLSGSPLWNSIGPDGIVQNLGISGSVDYIDTSSFGAIASNCQGLIVNCWSNANVKIQGYNSSSIMNSGNLVAYLKSGGAIVNSYVAGEINANGTTGALAATSERNTAVKNCYWLDTVNEKAVGSASGNVTDSSAKERADFYSSDFINILNSNKGEYGKTWAVSSTGYPYFGEAQNYVPEGDKDLPENKTAISFQPKSGSGSVITDQKLTVDKNEVDISRIAGSFSLPEYTVPEGASVKWACSEQNPEETGAINEDTGEFFVYKTGTLNVTATLQKADETTETLAAVKVTVIQSELEEIKLYLADSNGENGAEIKNGSAVVQGSETKKIVIKAKYSDKEGYQDISSDGFTFQFTDGTGKVSHMDNSSLFYFSEPGTASVVVTYKNNQDISASAAITSEYVAVDSVKPAISGRIVLHGRNANSDGGADFLPNYSSVAVSPANASYASGFNINSSNDGIAKYVASMVKGYVPYKAGTVTYTASINDNGTVKNGNSEVEYVYLNPLKSVTVKENKLTVKENQSISAGLIFEGTLTDGHEVTETGMNWSFSEEGVVSITRENGAWKRDESAPDNNMYFLSSEYTIRGQKEGTVTVTGTPEDQTSGAQPVVFEVTVTAGDAEIPADNAQLIADGITDAQNYWKAKNADEVSSFGNEWYFFTMTRSGVSLDPDNAKTYLDSVKSAYTTDFESDKTNKLKPTTLARVILATGALGDDPTNLGGANLIEMLYNSEKISEGGNEAIWALLALDSGKYQIPDGAAWTREKLIAEILEYQNPDDGGFAWTGKGEKADIDTTAMAIQALAPYYSSNPNAGEAIEKALTYLKSKMNSNCQFGSSEASSQVLIALTSLGKDPIAEENGFVKSVARNLISGLDAYREEGKGFKHLLTDTSVNGMATDQALRALEACRRLENKENSLYDLTDVDVRKTLEKRVAEAEALQKDNYNETLWTAMTQAKDAAKEILAKENATQTELKNADEVLASALAALYASNPNPGNPAEDIVVNVTIAEQGQLALGKDGTVMGDIPVTVEDRNKDGKQDIDEVLYAIHERYYEGGAETGYECTSSGWLVKLWGKDASSSGTYVNDNAANGLTDTVNDSDYVSVFTYKDTTYWADSFTKFSNNVYTVNIGESVILSLSNAGYDSSWNTVWSPAAGVKISQIGGTRISGITDENGELTISSLPEGTYKVLAYSDDGLTVPAVTTIIVKNPAVSMDTVSLRVADPSGRTYLAKNSYSFTEGETAYSILSKSGLKYSARYYGMYGGYYVYEIEGLAEFDKGAKSGWMYRVNGIYPEISCSEYKLKAGDYVEWLYTSDLGNDIGSSTPSTPDVSTSGSSGSATTTTSTQVVVKDDTATATVKDENAKEIIRQAAENKSKEIVINVKQDDVKTAEKVQVEIKTDTAKEVVEKTEAALIVSTPNGSVTLPQDVLKETLTEAKGKTIIIEVSLVSKPTEIQQNAAGTNGHIIAVTIKSDDKAITTFGGKSLTIKAEIPAKLNGKTVIAIHIADDGKIEKMTGKLVTENGKDFYEFETPHLSTFALADADEVKIDEPEQDKPSQDEADKAAEQKAKIKKVKTTVTLSTKGIKKGIKVTVKVPESKKADKTGIIIYRSTSKNAKPYAVYKKVSTKGSTYIIRNTKNVKGKNLTKGKTYYYKARAYKVINGKTYYGPMSAIKSIKAK